MNERLPAVATEVPPVAAAASAAAAVRQFDVNGRRRAVIDAVRPAVDRGRVAVTFLPGVPREFLR